MFKDIVKCTAVLTEKKNTDYLKLCEIFLNISLKMEIMVLELGNNVKIS